MGFGIELKRILKKKGIKVAQLSRETGIPANTLYAIINRDSNNISAGNFNRICKALNLGPDEQANLDMCLYPEKWFGSSRPTSTDKEVIREYVDMDEAPQKIVTYFDSDEYTPDELAEIKNYAEFLKSKRTTEPDK
ncbi:helix-turn-helix domain-containing protein [Enterocloster lavalensis]|uniref:helix-turn-helix domain-containing protein n=1 Tax=Enterocloster lavalensis TaxID=460384 RepID=UPI0015A6983D|nr:helix-turn-helix transcriptional regulator [Enterocloster lavalensis]